MPFGRHRGKRLVDVARDISYIDWLLAQHWFEQRYPVLFKLFQSDPLLVRIRAVEQTKLSEAEIRAQQLRTERETEQRARRDRWEQERLEAHRVHYRLGIMPFGKYKNQPLSIVARDKRYCRWFAGTAYARVNPELAADLRAAHEHPIRDVTVETLGDCTVYRPAVFFCRPE